MELPIYLDHAATTPVLPEVVEAMMPYFTERYGNPSALHQIGMAAREGVETARETLADCLHADPEEIVFTSGGTEADNAAIFGVAYARAAKGRHLLTTPIEHHAVLDPFERLKSQGYEVEFIPVDRAGRVDPDDIGRRIRSDTILVSVMHANNEIGTIEPIGEIGAICHAAGALFHTDAVQTFGRVPIHVGAMRIDLLSLSGHKFYGPKGVGALYVRRATPLQRYQEGGSQERGRRAGTLNVPGIVGLGKAAELIHASMASESARLARLRDIFISRLEAELPGTYLTGHRSDRLAGNIHLCFEGIEGEPLLLALDASGICASAGSACSAGSTEPSYVLQAIGTDRCLARGALRLTLGLSTHSGTMEYAARTLIHAVRDLRNMAFHRRDDPVAGT